MTDTTDESEDYVFLREWLERQSEPMPNIGVDWSVPSPLAKKRLPELKQETLFERKEVIE
jgi:hypothetical protein